MKPEWNRWRRRKIEAKWNRESPFPSPIPLPPSLPISLEAGPTVYNKNQPLEANFGYVLRARLLNLQFLKTAFFLNETQPSEKKINRIRFFTVLIYNIE